MWPSPKHIHASLCLQLSRNYTKALEQVSTHLEFFPKYLQHRNKQRLTKIHQYLIRMRKLRLKARWGLTSFHVIHARLPSIHKAKQNPQSA